MSFEVSNGSIHKHRDKWQGHIRWREVDGEGNAGAWNQLTKTWNIRSYKDEPGTPKDERDMRGSKKAADELAAWRAEIVAGLEAPEEKHVSHDVADYVEWYAKSKDGSGSIEASTYDGYAKAFRRIRERFGGTDISELTAEDVQAWINDMLKDGLTPYSVWHYYGPLRQAMTYAYDADVIPRNPCKKSLVKLPNKKPAKKPNPLDADGARDFWAKLDAEEETAITMGARLMLIGGLRNEEVCALRWGDVSEEDGRVVAYIEQAIGMGRHADGTGGAYVKGPKSEHGRRRIDMGAAMVGPWRAWKERQRLAYVEALGDLGRNEQLPPEYYVLGDVEGHYLNPTSFSRKFTAIAELKRVRGAAGRTITPYDLRHTFADLVDRSGASHKSAQTMMGHSSYKTTETIYTTADLDGMKSTADGVSAFIAEPPQPKHEAEVLPLKEGTTGA